MADNKNATLYDPQGNKYQTGSKVEATRLKAHGYSETAPKPPASAKSSKS